MKNLYNILIAFGLLTLPSLLLAQVTVNTAGRLTIPAANEGIRLSGSSSYLTFFNGPTYNGYLWHTNTDMYLHNLQASGSLYFGTAAANRMTIAANGNVGIGTTTPQVKLHVNNATGGNQLRMESTTGNGWAGFYAGASLEGWIENSNDDLNVTSLSGALLLRTLNTDDVRVLTGGKLSVETDEIRIDDTANKYLNFYNGATRVGYLSANTGNNMLLSTTNGGGIYINSAERINVNTPGGTTFFRADGNVGIGINSASFRLSVAGNVNVTGELTAASDARLKKNIHTLENALATIAKLNPVSYDFRAAEYPELDLAKRNKMGLLAQEVEGVLPNLVSDGNKITSVEGANITIKNVNYMEMVPLLIKSIQELEAKVQELENKLNKCAK